MKHRAQRGERAGTSRHRPTHVTRKLISILKKSRHGGRGNTLRPQIEDGRLPRQVILLDESDRIAHRRVLPQLRQGLVHVLILRHRVDLRLHCRSGSRNALTRGARRRRKGLRSRRAAQLHTVFHARDRRYQACPAPHRRSNTHVAPGAAAPHSGILHRFDSAGRRFRCVLKELGACFHQIARRELRRQTARIEPRTHQ